MACHIIGAATPSLPGNVGPDLSTIGNWGRADEWLFNYVRPAQREPQLGHAALGRPWPV